MKNNSHIKNIGIMGGTFNPIHYAHLIIAQYAFDKYNLDKILFIPTGKPPHKQTIALESGENRYNMVYNAIKDNPNFEASDIEIKRDKITYTIDTLKEIKQIYGQDINIYFITGTDAIEKIDSWREPEEIFKICTFAVATRPYYSIKETTNKIIKNNKNKITFFETPINSISSTEIRNRINKEKSIKYLLPTSVEKYIYENNLYKTDYYDKYKNQINILKQNLTEKRFNHSIEVAKQAEKLAFIYNVDTEKAFLAGLIHDCCKCFSKEKIFETAEKYNFDMDNILKEQPDLAHSFLGYFIAKDIYGILDEDILNSIKYHTTGRDNMSTLEKIVYISDCIEPTRAYFDGIEENRKIAYKNLDNAMENILKNTISFNQEKGRLIHPLSLEAYKFYCR